MHAPAKVNLALHVTGRRADGYHLLDSLVAFTRYGDEVTFEPAGSTTLDIAGRFADGVPTGPENLVLRALALFDGPGGLAIHLRKNLPHAAGLGGGSADAAAVLRYGARMGWPAPAPRDILALGADVPVCLRRRPARMRGIGDILEDVPVLPPLPIVLVNPGVPVPTGPVFSALASKGNAPLEPLQWQAGIDRSAAKNPRDFLDWLARQRNDLQPPAVDLVPEIGAALDALKSQKGCRLARMSGSGGTCFGLFPDQSDAAGAARALAASRAGWWAVSTVIDTPPTVHSRPSD